MKKLAYVLPVFAAGLILFSCVTSKTEDISAENPVSEKTEGSVPSEPLPDLNYSLISEKNTFDYFQYEITYPKFSNNPVLNKAINEHFLKYFKELKGSAKEEWTTMNEERLYYSQIESDITYSAPPPLEYFGSPDHFWESSDFLSIVYDEYSYLGGAHGNPLTYTITYSKKQNKIVNIEEASGMSMDRISHLCYEVLLEQFDDDGPRDLPWLQSGTEPVPENFNTFAITEDGKYLIVYFNPYQVAPYSYGMLSVKIEL